VGHEVDDAIELAVSATAQTMPIDAARTGGQRRRAVGHGELGLHAVTADITDLSQQLCAESSAIPGIVVSPDPKVADNAPRFGRADLGGSRRSGRP
jgi:hypothetical protein